MLSRLKLQVNKENILELVIISNFKPCLMNKIDWDKEFNEWIMYKIKY